MDYKLLNHLYQPMIGAYAISTYMLLFQHIPAEQLGYSKLEQQRKLFLSLQLEPSERGRKWLTEQTSLLEAVGLLQTTQKWMVEDEEQIFEYRLFAPLNPYEFFKNHHLTLLLRDKIGKHAVLALKSELCCEVDASLQHKTCNEVNLSVPFYEVFQLNSNMIDEELEQALSEVGIGEPEQATSINSSDYDVQYADIIMRFPRHAKHRPFVEKLKYKPEQLADLNYIANKYQIGVTQLCRLLDEEGVFDNEGMLLLDGLQQQANLIFSQQNKREQDTVYYLNQKKANDTAKQLDYQDEVAVAKQHCLEVPPSLVGKCSMEQYNMMLRNEPYIKVLQNFFPGTVPEHVYKIFSVLNLNYKCPDEVLNVLIHYLKVNNFSWNRPFIESIVSDMLGKDVTSYETAVDYIRLQTERKRKKDQPSNFRQSKNKHKKPQIAMHTNTAESTAPVSEEEYERGLQKAKMLEKMLKQKDT